MSIPVAQQLNSVLKQTLEPLGSFERCALLNYPNYGNIGDHLIGLGTFVHLTQVVGCRIAYTASLTNFDAAEMDRKIDRDTPILLQGGGNFGDLWYEHQQFREWIISNYPHNPIFILPQTIYFKNAGCLKEAKKAINNHENLHIFCRDRQSYEFAREEFSGCQLSLATDMAFALADMPQLQLDLPRSPHCFYMKRQDKELSDRVAPDAGRSNLTVGDWVSYDHRWLLEDVVQEWAERELPVNFGALQNFILRTLTFLYREGWQRGLTRPQEMLHRRSWMAEHPYVKEFRKHDKPELYNLSLSLIHSGIYQFSQYPGLVTSRLHGHILSVLMGIPHVFLPNSYHKNTMFYQSWSHVTPFCEFVEDDREIFNALDRVTGRA